jgi:hypothetical protein
MPLASPHLHVRGKDVLFQSRAPIQLAAPLLHSPVQVSSWHRSVQAPRPLLRGSHLTACAKQPEHLCKFCGTKDLERFKRGVLIAHRDAPAGQGKASSSVSMEGTRPPASPADTALGASAGGQARAGRPRATRAGINDKSSGLTGNALKPRGQGQGARGDAEPAPRACGRRGPSACSARAQPSGYGAVAVKGPRMRLGGGKTEVGGIRGDQ